MKSRLGLLLLLTTSMSPIFVNAENNCPTPQVKPGELYDKYLGNYDYSEVTEVSRKIVDASGKQIGLLIQASHQSARDHLLLVYDNEGNLMGYGVESAADSRLMSTILKTAAEHFTGLDLGVFTSIDGAQAIECVKKKEEKKQQPEGNLGDINLTQDTLQLPSGVEVVVIDPGVLHIPNGTVTITEIPIEETEQQQPKASASGGSGPKEVQIEPGLVIFVEENDT